MNKLIFGCLLTVFVMIPTYAAFANISTATVDYGSLAGYSVNTPTINTPSAVIGGDLWASPIVNTFVDTNSLPSFMGPPAISAPPNSSSVIVVHPLRVPF